MRKSDPSDRHSALRRRKGRLRSLSTLSFLGIFLILASVLGSAGCGGTEGSEKSPSPTTNSPPTTNTPPDSITTAEPVVTISGGTSVTEGTAASFILTANPAPSASLDVKVTVTDAPNSDFVGSLSQDSRTVTISATRGTQSFTVQTTEDTDDEPNGQVMVTVNNGSGYTVGSASSHSVTVNDNDPTTVTLATPDASAEEGSGTNTASITLTLSRGLVNGETLKVPLRFTGGSVGTDFTLTCPVSPPRGVSCTNLANSNAAVTFAGPSSGVSATAVTITLTAARDQDAKDRTVTVSIPPSSTGNGLKLTAANLGDGTKSSIAGNGQIVIADNDSVPRPMITISGGTSVTEGTAASFILTANPAPGAALDVKVTVTDAPNSDFVGSLGQGSRTVTIPATRGTHSFTVATTGDTNDEPNGHREQRQRLYGRFSGLALGYGK